MGGVGCLVVGRPWEGWVGPGGVGINGGFFGQGCARMSGSVNGTEAG